MQNEEQRLNSRQVYAGKVVQLSVDQVRLPDGQTATREVVRHPGAVAILAVDDRQQVWLVRQYRYAVQEELWELPAGKLEGGEQPQAAAERELAEEAGLKADSWQLICSMYTAPGFCNERIWLYRACGLRPTVAQPDWDEQISAQAFAREQLQQMLLRGAIRDAKTLVGLLHYLSTE
ncbi:MAG: NUDIX hydrolase [Bacillota bacterium]|jgi:ADP-ribose pyrophosphatase